jgi:mRNA interferase RelE/StbE
MSYTAKFPTQAIRRQFLKDMAALPPDLQDKGWEAIRHLERNPRPFGTKIFKQLKPPVYLYAYAASYRLRIGGYRILYDVDDKTKTVWVFALRKRNEKTYKK